MSTPSVPNQVLNKESQATLSIQVFANSVAPEMWVIASVTERLHGRQGQWYLSTWRIAPFGEVLAGLDTRLDTPLQSIVVTQIPA